MTVKPMSTTARRSHQASSRLTRLTLAVIFAVGALMILFSGVAAAKNTRVVESSFNGSDSPGGAISFGPFGGVAIDNSSGPSAGDAYVGETSFFTHESRVIKFEPTGTYAGVEFNGAETPAGSFGFLNFAEYELGSLTVDGSSGANAGDIYVADSVNNVVDRFNEEGEFLCQITGKTPFSQAEKEAECAGATGSATPAGGFQPGGVVVSPVDGTVYVGDQENRVVDIFNAAGEYAGQISDSHVTTPTKLAIDSNGNLYVDNATLFGGTTVAKFNPSGDFVSVIDEKEPGAVTVDPSDDHVFVYEAETKQIAEYDESGNLLMTFGHEYEFANLGAATSNKVYATHTAFEGSSIEIYGSPVTIPNVTATAVTEVEQGTVTLNGEVDPAGGGEVESCEFEYGTSTSYGQGVPCSQTVPFSATTAVSAEISGLSPSTKYHFRVVAANHYGVNSYSGDEVFYTRGAPTIESESAKGESRYTAQVEAMINPHGYSTGWKVEYVDKAHYEAEGFNNASSAGPLTIGEQLTPQSVTMDLTGLSVETTYYYRVIATNSVESTVGAIRTFATVPVVEVQNLYPSGENTSALLREKVNPLGLDTTCQIEYLSEAEFEVGEWASAKTVPCTPENLGAGSTMVYVRSKVGALEGATTYHSRFVLSNVSGTLRTPDRMFTTFGLKKFRMAALTEEGEPVTQAGAHPYEFDTEIEVNTNEWQAGGAKWGAAATLKDVHTELPPGLIGNPNGVPQCQRRLEEVLDCPPDTQIGLIGINLVGDPPNPEPGWTPVFNLVPPKGVAAKFGAWINIGISAYIQADVRTGKDYGINADSLSITSFANARLIKLKLWGNPGDPAHTAAGERYCARGAEQFYENPCSPAGLSERPFLSMPTHCTGAPLAVGGSVDSYQEPSNPIAISTAMEPITGCNALEFNPSLEARPTTNVADSPTGLQVDLHVPQNEDESGLRVADLRDAKVTLPPGLVVNPSGANGLVGCSSAAFDEHGPGAGNCPDAAKIGTAEVDTPLIGHPLPGAVYIATPYDNPFHSLLAIYVEINDPQSGVIIKLAGHVEADPQTGQLTTTFDENPQLPFEDFKLDFFKGATAPLRTPAVCGNYQTTSVLTPWSAPESGPSPTPSDSYAISQAPGGGACATSAGALSNAPVFDAGTLSPSADKYTPMVLHLRREDGTQEFEKLTVTPPVGLLAKLAGTPYCPDSAIAAAAGKSGAEETASPSCPTASEVGTVHVGAGAGPAPYYVNGHVYLAGPYKGAPLSLAIITPATAGPYDLGTVAVRVALQVDPETTQITAVSDPIPHILDGIPLDIRSIGIELGKPEFTRNGTSCDPTTLGGELGTILGQSISLSNHFQLGDCTNLGFKPKLQVSLKGSTKHAGHPALRAVVTYPKGGAYANIARAQVNLPHSEFLDQSNLNKTCTRPVLLEGKCPTDTIYGTARAWSPLLEKPLEGSVYLVGGYGYKLPALVAELNGQIRVLLVGKVDSGKNHGIRNTFEAVPDAPVEKFVLEMKGGKKYGLLENSENLCKRPQRASAVFTAQNGLVQQWNPVVANQCKKVKVKKSAKKAGEGTGAGKGKRGH